MKIKDRARPKLPPVAPGTYIGICVGVIDLGEQYSEKFKNYAPKVQIVWELAGQTVEVDGEQKPRQLSKEFTFSTSKKAALRAMIVSWTGTQFSDEAFADFELFDLIGRAGMLNVVLSETGEYANIEAVIPVPAGMPVPAAVSPPVRWDMQEWNDAVFETLPEWVREKIMKSSEYQAAHLPTEKVDFPAAQNPVDNSGSVVYSGISTADGLLRQTAPVPAAPSPRSATVAAPNQAAPAVSPSGGVPF